MFPYRLVDPTPEPADIPTEPWEASPGLEGFVLGFFVLGIALAFLMWSMNRHLRSIKHAAQAEQKSADTVYREPVSAESAAKPGDTVAEPSIPNGNSGD